MNKKQKVCISLLSVHSFLLLIAFVNIFVNIYEYFSFKPYSFSYSYEFFFLPLYRIIYENSIIDIFFLLGLIGFSVYLTVMEYKEIINWKSKPNTLFPISNGLWTASCCILSLTFLMLPDSDLCYSYNNDTNMIYINVVSMIIGEVVLTIIAIIMTDGLVRNRTYEEFENAKYLTPKKTNVFLIASFIMVFCLKWFMIFGDTGSLERYFDVIKYTMYGFGIYIAVGSILQSVNRIRKLKKINYINSEEQIAVFRSDRKKKIISLAVFVLSYFIFYLF